MSNEKIYILIIICCAFSTIIGEAISSIIKRAMDKQRPNKKLLAPFGLDFLDEIIYQFMPDYYNDCASSRNRKKRKRADIRADSLRFYDMWINDEIGKEELFRMIYKLIPEGYKTP